MSTTTRWEVKDMIDVLLSMAIIGGMLVLPLLAIVVLPTADQKSSRRSTDR